MLYVYRYSSELEIECKVKAAHLFLAGGDGLAAVLARDYHRRRHGGGGGHRHGEGRAGGGAVPGLVPLDAELHDPLGGLGSVAAALDEALDVGLGEAHPEPHGAAVPGSLHGRQQQRRRRHVRRRPPRQHEALEPLPGAVAERARPRPLRRAAAQPRELDEEVEPAGLERRVRVERARAHAEAAHLLRVQQAVARVVAQRVPAAAGGRYLYVAPSTVITRARRRLPPMELPMRPA